MVGREEGGSTSGGGGGREGALVTGLPVTGEGGRQAGRNSSPESCEEGPQREESLLCKSLFGEAAGGPAPCREGGQLDCVCVHAETSVSA